jgi:hypothetical protein
MMTWNMRMSTGGTARRRVDTSAATEGRPYPELGLLGARSHAIGSVQARMDLSDLMSTRTMQRAAPRSSARSRVVSKYSYTCIDMRKGEVLNRHDRASCAC